MPNRGKTRFRKHISVYAPLAVYAFVILPARQLAVKTTAGSESHTIPAETLHTVDAVMKLPVVLSLSMLLSLAGPPLVLAQPNEAAAELPAPTVSQGLKIWHNLSYVPGSNDYRQKLDVGTPTAGGPFPLIVWVHGGAWLQGSKENPPLQPVLQNGYAVASINYRLSTQAPFPAQIQDCKTAIRFLRAHAKQFNIDPNRIGVWGMSAGGHLAAMLATTSGVKEFEGVGYNNFSSAVECASDYCGPADLSTIKAQTQGPQWKLHFDNPGSVLHTLMNNDVRPDRLRWASPAHYLTKGDAPLQIIHGDKDDVVPFAQSEEFFAQVKKIGIQSEFTREPGAGHNLYSPQNTRRTLKFFDQYLKPKAKEPPKKTAL